MAQVNLPAFLVAVIQDVYAGITWTLCYIG